MLIMEKKRETKAILAFIVVCILWGSTYLAIRIGVQTMPPALFAGIRFLVAGSLMLLLTQWRGQAWPSSWYGVAQQALVGLFLLLGGNGLVVWGEQWVDSGVASLLIATQPLFMALISFVFPAGRRLGWTGWVGLLVGFGGVAYLVLAGTGSHTMNLHGALLIILASFFWSLGSVYSQRIKASGSLFANLGIQMLSGGVALMLVGIFLGEFSHLHFTGQGLGATLYLIIFGSLVAYNAYGYLLQQWSASKVGTYAYINPVVALILGALILGEPVTPSLVGGASIILIGVLIVHFAKNTASRQASNSGENHELKSAR
ncbi:MAG: EamA family transporter [Desulfitobacteriaceae bacterium]